MKISDAIIVLGRIMDKHGDLDICGYDHNADCLTTLNDIYASKYDDCDEMFAELNCDMMY